MANNPNSNPAIFTATTGSYKALVAASQGKFITLLIEKVYWRNPNAIGDTLLITDPQSGATLLNLRAEVANQSQIVDWTSAPKLWADFAIDEIDSGTAEIYFR